MTWMDGLNRPAVTPAPRSMAWVARGVVTNRASSAATGGADRSASVREVSEPPHWMILWPIDAAATGLPTKPNSGGTYVMFAGTPYAHLMIHQDPKRLKN